MTRLFGTYVGIAKKKNDELYYFVEKDSESDFIKGTDGENIAPHRINVGWQFDEQPFDNVDFSMWRDTVHKVTKNDLDKVKNQKLKNYLEQKVVE